MTSSSCCAGAGVCGSGVRPAISRTLIMRSPALLSAWFNSSSALASWDCALAARALAKAAIVPRLLYLAVNVLPPRIAELAIREVADARLSESLSRLLLAEASPPEVAARALEEACRPTSMGGMGVGGQADLCAAAYAASVLNCWRRLEATSSVMRGVNMATSDIPMLREARAAYDALRAERDRGGGPKEKSRFHPKSLTPAEALPPLHALFATDCTEPLRIPAQRGLSAVYLVHNARWLEALTAAAVWDQAHAADTPIRNREMARVVIVRWRVWWPSRKRVRARGWRLRPMALTAPGLTRMNDFLIAIQRRYGLRLSMVAAANDVLAAVGAVEHVDRLGDRLAQEHNTRHNQILNRWCDVQRAVATGLVVLGDKDEPGKTAQSTLGTMSTLPMRAVVTMVVTSSTR
eukprot:scaffold20751_cov124-Isochrysis_galbana.AAC.8